VAIDGINTKQQVYRPVRSRNRKSSEFDKIFQSDETSAAKDDEERKSSKKRQPKSPPETSPGGIDEHV